MSIICQDLFSAFYFQGQYVPLNTVQSASGFLVICSYHKLTYLIKLSTLVNCLKYTHVVIQPLSLKTYDMPCKFLPPNKIPLHTYSTVSINANYSPTGAICYQKLGYRRKLQHRGCQQVEAISIKISLKVIN